MADPVVVQIEAAPAERARLGAVRRLVDRTEPTVTVTVGDQTMELPPSLVRVLAASAVRLEHGESVAVVGDHAEVSPAQAAQLLGVSRQYVDRLITNGVLPARRLPNSRYKKIPARAVLAHRASKDAKRAGIAAIVETAEQAGLSY